MVYLFVVLVNSASIVQFHANSSPHVLFHPLNWYEYCAVFHVAIAKISTSQIVNLFPLVLIATQYSAVNEPLVTLPYSSLFELIVIS